MFGACRELLQPLASYSIEMARKTLGSRSGERQRVKRLTTGERETERLTTYRCPHRGKRLWKRVRGREGRETSVIERRVL